MAFQTAENHADELYEASMKGCTLTLDRLIQADQLILHKVSLNSHSDTPLHIASLLGHHDFAIALLRNYPQLATELDALGQSPLHLASAKGHNEIVKALLTVEKDVCMVRDHEGRIPLHLAVMRGRLEVVGLLIKARPESVWVNLDEETVLHLCIRYHHFEVLEPFMQLFKDRDYSDHFGSKDVDGNTVLHQAVILHQLKTTRCLLTIPGVQANRNAINNNGFTALDIMQHNHPRRSDFKTLEIRDILVKAGIETKSGERNVLPQSSTTSARSDSIFSRPQSLYSSILSRWIKLKISKLHEARGSLMVVATVIATMSYQTVMNPPGGVWQGNTESSPFCTKENMCEAGTAVLAFTHTKAYMSLISLNCLCFFSSLIFILLLLAGLSLNNIISVMALETLMSVTISLLGQTFLLGVLKLSPNFVFQSQLGRGLKFFMKMWFAFTLVAAFLPCTFQFIYEIKKSLREHQRIHSLNNERTTA